MRRALGVVVSMLVVALAPIGFAVPASAAGAGDTGASALGDNVSRFAIDYNVTADGVLHVTETIDYEFGDPESHGIFRDLVIREPFVNDKSKDQKYEVSHLTVSSPTAPDSFDTSTIKTNGARNQVLRIKIGSSDSTVGADEATYKISYEVRGALRHFADHSELFWDATGGGWEAFINQADIAVTVPQGVQKVACFYGPAGATDSCKTHRIVAGKGVFGETGVSEGSQVTIVAGLKAGAVSNDTPIVVDPPGFLERNGLSRLALIVSAVVTIVVIVAGKLFARRGRDRRYAGVPPGTVPPIGVRVRTVGDSLEEDQLPVAFAPPDIPVAEAGLLVDGKANTREVAATLIDLAVRGAVRIENADGTRTAVLVDAGVATAGHEQSLLHGLFPGQKPGAQVELESPKKVGDFSMARTARFTIDALRKQVEKRQWYTRMPSRSGLDPSSGNGWGALGCGVLFAAIVMLVSVVIGAVKFGAPAWLGRAVVIGVPAGVFVWVAIWWFVARRAGRRTPIGRAMADQVVGFRKYLATAEADQLRFEDGDDVFSRYLPWAIVFDLADRWQKVCQDLVDAGRLTADPGWYAGPSYYTSGWSGSQVTTTVSSTFSQPPSPSTGGGTSSGFSSSSSSSSSSSGGGGGGGGGGSW